jgi:hypothetical protein
MNEVVTFFHNVDRRNWPAIRAGLADELDTDYTSLFGGEPERLSAETLIERWQALLPGFDATQHFLGPLAVVAGNGGDTVVECSVRGYHRLDGRVWMVAGSYTLTVRNGRIAGIVLHTSYEEGDRALTEEAAKRVA